MPPSSNPTDEARLASLFHDHFGAVSHAVVPLRAHGSDRRIYRLTHSGGSCIGVVNRDRSENRAFVSFARHFRASGLPAPEVLSVADDEEAYLEEDLGDVTLFDLLNRERSRAGGSDKIPDAVASVYEQAVRCLPRFQVEAGRGIDESLCYPRARFDRRSMSWDLNYFKYHFLKLAGIAFDEQSLEDDFEALITFLLEAPSEYFLYRDFQSRNIMVRDGAPWFIDFQGGRRGPLHYDIASILVDAKANLPPGFRRRLLDIYLDALGSQLSVDRASFLEHYDGFLLIRLLQAMGAYGFRGFYERKTHFLQSVPYAIRNLESFLSSSPLPRKLPALAAVLQAIVDSDRFHDVAQVRLPLGVRIESFSYKRGYPEDVSGHGGGFVFDCRALPNPGREARYARMAGDDQEVIAWLEGHEDVHRFLAHVFDLLGQVVASYGRRQFTHLSVGFGCTGGQHRSVYCATRLAEHLRQTGSVQVHLSHRDVIRTSSDEAGVCE